MVTPPDELAPANKSASVTPHKRDESAVDFELFQGPLPHAQDFAAYERVLPGAADRILKMAERDQKARLRQEAASWFGVFAAMLLGRLFLYMLVLAAVYLAAHDKPLEAFFAGLAPIVVAIYANTRKDESTQPDEEDKP